MFVVPLGFSLTSIRVIDPVCSQVIFPAKVTCVPFRDAKSQIFDQDTLTTRHFAQKERGHGDESSISLQVVFLIYGSTSSNPALVEKSPIRRKLDL